MVHRTDRSSASFLVPSARQWLARRLAGWITLQLPSSFLPLVSGLPDGLPGGSLFGFLPRSFRSSVACLTATWTHRSSAYFIVSSARQWLPSRLAGWIAVRLPSSFLPLVSGLPDGLSGGSLFGFLPRSFRSSVAYPTAPRTDRSSAYFLVSSAPRWLTGRIADRLTSSFLLIVSGLPDGSFIGLLPLPSARQWLAGRIACQLTSSFLPLISGLPGGSLFGLLPPTFRPSVACLARRRERS